MPVGDEGIQMDLEDELPIRIVESIDQYVIPKHTAARASSALQLLELWLGAV